VIDVALAHNALVYDACRNVYYASVPASQPSGNSIATIDPNTGQVSFSPPIGSEPNALAMAADGGVLYVGLDGTGDVVKLALPSMTEQGRVTLPSDSFLGQMRAETLAVSPADPTAVAVAMMSPATTVRHSGVALLRNMILQPKMTPRFGDGIDVVAFDSSGARLYGLNSWDSEFGLRRIQVLADGLAVDLVLPRVHDSFGTTALAIVEGRIVAGRGLFEAPALLPLGVVSGATECLRARSARLLLCLKSNSGTPEARLLVANADTFAIRASLLAAASEPIGSGRRLLVEGPSSQVAISYSKINASDSRVLLFSSELLLAPPTPPVVPPPVTPFSTADGQGLDIGLAHNSLVYDRTRNRYYASVPGSVLGTGNTVAIIDPATGQVTQSGPVGSEPNVLAVAPDGSTLYVGLDGSSEVIKLALPAMAELARIRLDLDPNLGRTNAQSIAVSPADPAVVAVSVAISNLNPGNTRTLLLRDMVAQPKRTAFPSEDDFLVFDPSGGILYGADVSSPFLGLHASSVLPDGLVEQNSINRASSFSARTFSFSNNRLIVGSAVHDATSLAAAGRITTQSDCIPLRSVAHLVCLAPAFSVAGPVQLLLADPATFVIRGSLQFGLNQNVGQRTFVEGPDGQVAVGYPGTPNVSDPKIRLFSSAQLLTLPTPPPVSWPIASSSTSDGQVLDIGIVHNALVYDSARNLYYASVPGSVIGSGNTIASIDPATGGVAHSAPIGSDPNPLAIAADGSALYVGLDGTGELLRLALPSMTETGRVRLPVLASSGQSHALAIAMSPANAGVAAVSFDLGAALLRDMVVQPRFAPFFGSVNLLAFDTSGTALYRAGGGSARLLANEVVADGLVEQFSVDASGSSSLGFANNLVITGPRLYSQPTLAPAGSIAGASDCWPDRSGDLVLCFGSVFSRQVLVASSTTFAVAASPVYGQTEPDFPRRLVQGPTGQIAIDYVPVFAAPSIRLFTSAQLP